MSWIGNNLLETPFSGFSAPQGETGLGQSAPVQPARPQADALYASFPGSIGQPVEAGSGFASDSGGLSGLMSGFSNYITNLFNQISSWYQNGGTGTTTAATSNGSGSGAASAGYGSTSAQYGSRAGTGGWGEQYFQSASASSWGDPHDTFDGTSGNGQNVNSSWDNMRSHQDLLDSNSFCGGYRVSTQTTQPNGQGVTMNGSASITTDNGNTVVSMNANGQYQISSYGNNVTLQSGQTAQLDSGESVTLNSDGSVTVTDTNAQNGRLSTTLSANGNGGVDVKSQAADVDLGGYLVSHSDGQSPKPYGPLHAQPYAPTNPEPVGPFAPSPLQSPFTQPSYPQTTYPRPTPDASPFDQIDQLTN